MTSSWCSRERWARAGLRPDADRTAFDVGAQVHTAVAEYRSAVRNGRAAAVLAAGLAGSSAADVGQLTSADAVLAATWEHDVTGPATFEIKYGFTRQHKVIVHLDERVYDAVAIAGAALAYQPGIRHPLAAGRLSAEAAAAQLRSLGFTVSSGR